MDNLPHGRDDDVAEESTTRCYIEATDGKTLNGAWFRGSYLGRADGYETAAEAEEFMDTIDPYDRQLFQPALTGLRVVEEVNTCRITVVTRRG